jgi:hypothetical protein
MDLSSCHRLAAANDFTNFFKQKGFSKAQLARLKFSGGQIFVNHRERYTNYQLHDQDVIRVFWRPN